MSEERREFLDMTDERKERMRHVASKVIDLVHAELPNPIEAHIVLKLCMQALGVRYGILDTAMLDDGSEMKQ